MRNFLVIIWLFVLLFACRLSDWLGERRVKRNLDQTYERYFRQMVEAGGGQWVGVQEWEGKPYDLIMFNSPTTGTTLALRSDQIDAASVAERISESDEKFGGSK